MEEDLMLVEEIYKKFLLDEIKEGNIIDYDAIDLSIRTRKIENSNFLEVNISGMIITKCKQKIKSFK